MSRSYKPSHEENTSSRSIADNFTQNGIQRMAIDPFNVAQREMGLEEEELKAPAQTKSIVQKKEENNTGMSDQLKSGVEQLSGMDMSDVKVHYNSSQPAQLNALAYAQGTDIHVAPGQERHVPHEAWHVVQQKQGRVQATMQMKEGIPVNDDVSLEREADVMGAQALLSGQA